MRITFFLILILVNALLTAMPVRAEEIRIACIIPETPGINIPLVSENTYRQARITQKEASLAIQKESTETRLVEGSAKTCLVQTVYTK
jgi:hypothetical protein